MSGRPNNKQYYTERKDGFLRTSEAANFLEISKLALLAAVRCGLIARSTDHQLPDSNVLFRISDLEKFKATLT